MTTPRAALRLLGVAVVAAVAGLLALVGVAVVSARPAVFLGAGLAVFLAATAAGVVLSTRRLPWRRRRRARVAGSAVCVLVGVATFVVTALLPLGDPRLPPAPVAGQRFWALPTGSRIARVRVPARGRAAGHRGGGGPRDRTAGGGHHRRPGHRDDPDAARAGGPPAWPLARPPLLLETSLPGVFAAGDVRHGSSSGSPRPSARTRSPSSWSTSTWPRRRRPRLRPGGSERAPQDPMATGRPATARSRAVIPAQPGVGAAAAGE